MSRPERPALRFVRAVLAGAEVSGDDVAKLAAGVRLALPAFQQLVSAGVVNAEGRPRPEARSWLKRQLLDADAFAAQHRVEMQQADGIRINLAESPLVRLATGATPFLAPHQVEAGERVRQLCDRARLQPRLTMSYSAAHVVGGTRAAAGELSDMAADAQAAGGAASRPAGGLRRGGARCLRPAQGSAAGRKRAELAAPERQTGAAHRPRTGGTAFWTDRGGRGESKITDVGGKTHGCGVARTSWFDRLTMRSSEIFQ